MMAIKVEVVEKKYGMSSDEALQLFDQLPRK